MMTWVNIGSPDCLYLMRLHVNDQTLFRQIQGMTFELRALNFINWVSTTWS